MKNRKPKIVIKGKVKDKESNEDLIVNNSRFDRSNNNEITKNKKRNGDNKYYRKAKKNHNKKLIIAILILIVGFVIGVFIYSNMTEPALVLKEYFKDLSDKNYDSMYDLVKTDLSKEDFVNRIKNIYDGIEASNISIIIAANITNQKSNQDVSITYTNYMNTIAGDINFINTAKLICEDGKYKINWDSSMIFSELDNNEKVRVNNIESTRGKIYDRNGVALAKEGTCYSVGLVKGKMDSTTDISQIASLLGISTDTINTALNASYVKDDTFVPLRKISKDNQDTKNELLKIKGIMITDAKVRVYPYKEATSILIGYVQNGDGKSGLEYSYNDKLKGSNGVEIYIEKDSKKVKTIAKKDVKDGEDLKLTIDVEKQKNIYEQFKDDEGTSIAMNYNTGEILALVSTPSYDANDFSLGITDEEWNSLQNNEKKPMYNRYLSTYAPGSSLKPIIGAIGLENSSFTADEDFGTSGTKWQKDSSWKDLYITTLETYSGKANLQNALIYSDNIYFAKAALKIGKSNLSKGLDNLGFNEKLTFVQDISKSTYGSLDSDAFIANSGYGQGEVLVNPIHIASIYSAFANGGNMVLPYIEQNYENNATTAKAITQGGVNSLVSIANATNNVKYYKQNVINFNICNTIKEDLRKVVTDGTATDCNIEGKKIYGKTGTAEVKSSQDDENGTEIGWFDAFDDNGLEIISMVQNVKDIGGSHYVVKKVRNIF